MERGLKNILIAHGVYGEENLNEAVERILLLLGVVGQSEQLKAFAEWRNKKDDSIPWITAMEIEEYVKSL